MTTRTAPLMTAAATKRSVTLHLIDASGDTYPVNIDVAVTAAAGDIEGLAASYAACTNASLYAITDTQERNGAAISSNAVNTYRAGIENGINLLFKRPGDGDTFGLRVIAPVAETMVGDTDTPAPFDTPLDELVTDMGTLQTAYFLNSAQYTVHKERKNNTRVKG